MILRDKYVRTAQSVSKLVPGWNTRVIKIIMGYSYREYCRELFKELNINTLITAYILFVIVCC